MSQYLYVDICQIQTRVSSISRHHSITSEDMGVAFTAGDVSSRASSEMLTDENNEKEIESALATARQLLSRMELSLAEIDVSRGTTPSNSHGSSRRVVSSKNVNSNFTAEKLNTLWSNFKLLSSTIADLAVRHIHPLPPVSNDHLT